MKLDMGPKGGRLPRRWEPVRCVVAGLIVAALGTAVYWAFRLAYADRLYHAGTPAAVSEARRLSPGNASYFQNDPRDRQALERAVRANPRHSQSWIELGLLAELDGDRRRAERRLLAAASVDRTYEPLWSLANFYFRQADQDKFWTWARRAAEITNYDQTPLFRLCWRATTDPAVILARGIPDRPESLAQYLNYLLNEEKLAEAEAVAGRLIPRSTADSVPLLVSYCDSLIKSGRMDAAVVAWNSLCQRRLLPYRSLEPQLGNSVTNGDFAAPLRAAGFDWRMASAEGINLVRSGPPPALRISFSGRQPEQLDVLSQVLPVMALRTYRLAYSWKTSGLPVASGLRWQVCDLATRKELASAPVGVSEGEWGWGVLSFAAPAAKTGVLLVLQYRRAEGTTRSEGALWLGQVSSSFQ